MSIVRMSEKGQVAIPQGIRKKLKIAKGDPLLVDMDSQGGIRLRVATVLPVENYSNERLKEFGKENMLTAEEKKCFRKYIRG